MKDPCPRHDGEAALSLRAALAPQYMTLRRLLAQIAGLLLLSNSRRCETQDGIAVSLAALRHELAEVEGVLAETGGRLAVRSLSLERLGQAAAAVQQALRVIAEEVQHSRWRNAGTEAPRMRAIESLQHARSIMGSIADDQRGFVMVGFSHACCCGDHLP